MIQLAQASDEARRPTEKSDIMYNLPDERGHFGQFGGVFVAETLVHALDELRDAYAKYQKDPEFVAEYERELKYFVGRPSPFIMRNVGAKCSAAPRCSSSARI